MKNGCATTGFTMTKKKAAPVVSIDENFWTRFDDYSPLMPIPLAELAKLQNTSVETLRRNHEKNLPPPLQDLTLVLGPAKHGGPNLGLTVGRLRELLSSITDAGASPQIGYAAEGRHSGSPLIDQATQREEAASFAATARARRERRAQSSSFAQFMATASSVVAAGDAEQVWLFRRVGVSRRPVDYFLELDEAELLPDGSLARQDINEDLDWMTIGDYSDALQDALRIEQDHARSLDRLRALEAIVPSSTTKRDTRS